MLNHNVYCYCKNNPIRYYDFDGQEPGESFSTMDEAAIDAAQYLSTMPQATEIEYGVWIYQIEATKIEFRKKKKIKWLNPLQYTYYYENVPVEVPVTQYVYTDSFTSDLWDRVDPPTMARKYKRVALVHTHPWPFEYECPTGDFSPQDKTWAMNHNVSIYAYTAQGTLLLYDIDIDKTFVLHKNLPSLVKKDQLQ